MSWNAIKSQFRKRDSIFRSVFALDLRSLALFRMGLGLFLIVDTLNRLRHFEAHYSEQGIYPQAVLSDPEFWLTFYHPYRFSLFLLSSSDAFTLLIFGLGILVGVALMIGYSSRWMSILAWIYLSSLWVRQPFIADFGDEIMLRLSFWAMFLPLGGPRDGRTSVSSMASAAFMIQLLSVYFFSAFQKNTAAYWEGDAVHLLLHFDQHVLPLGIWFRQFTGITHLATWLTLVLEFFGPLVFLFSFKNYRLRVALVLAFLVFHLLLGVTIVLGTFVLACWIAWLAFLPGEFWSRVRWRPTQWHGAKSLTLPFRIQSRLKLANSAFGAIGITMILYFNIANLPDFKKPGEFAPMTTWFEPFFWPQKWDMYAPYPPIDDGWPVFVGKTNLGNKVNLLEPDQPVHFKKLKGRPSSRYFFGNQRWANYLSGMMEHIETSPEEHLLPSALSRYLCLSAGRSLPEGEVIDRVELYYMDDPTIYKNKVPVRDYPAPRLWWVQECEK